MELERKLLKKIKKGNQQAFRILYDRYAGDAIRTVYAITRNNNHTFDIVQETFIKVFRHIDRFDVSKPFKPWFYRILVNESMRYMKKEAKLVTGLTEDTLDYLGQQHSSSTYDDLEIAMERLQPEMRTLLVLKYVNSYTEQEIARLLDVPKSTVKSRLYQARNELRAYLGGMANE